MTRRAYSNYLSDFNRPFVYRASALFWAVRRDDADTSVEFLNFWKLKRNVPEVGIVVTLRDLDGELRLKESFVARESKAFSISVRDLLAQAGDDSVFEGSLEVEIYAGQDLRFAYPGILCLYHGRGWHSVVHTYTRSLSPSSADPAELIFQTLAAEETNWTIRDSEAYESFFILHNGPLPCRPSHVEVKAYNHRGECLPFSIDLAARPPFSTVRITPGRHANLAGFLEGRPGWMIARFPVRGVFSRLLTGHIRKSDGAILSLTHSHFNSRNARDFFELDGGSPPPKPMFIAVPTRNLVPWDTRVIFYRTSYPTAYDAEMVWYTRDGAVVKRDSFPLVKKGEAGRWDSIVLDASPGGNGDAAAADLIAYPLSAKLPTRTHLGVEFDSGRGLPFTCTTGFATFRKPRYSSYWFPVLRLPDCQDYVVIINTDAVAEADQPSEIAMEFYRTSDENILRHHIILRPNATYAGRVDELVGGLAEFLGQQRGWCLMRVSPRANLHLFYATVNTLTGCIAGDHGF